MEVIHNDESLSKMLWPEYEGIFGDHILANGFQDLKFRNGSVKKTKKKNIRLSVRYNVLQIWVLKSDESTCDLLFEVFNLLVFSQIELLLFSLFF